MPMQQQAALLQEPRPEGFQFKAATRSSHEAAFELLCWAELEQHDIDPETDTELHVGVWEIAPRSQCPARTGRGPIRCRWVDVNKGDDKNKVYRSRFVATETRKMHGGNVREGLFAAMPSN